MRRRFELADGMLVDGRSQAVLGRLVAVTIDLDLGGTIGGDLRSELLGASEENSNSGDGESEGKNQITEVWDHYVERLAGVDGVDTKRMKLDSTRRTIIRNALKVRTIDECKRAIDGLAVSPFHNGENDQRTKYLGIRYALKGNSRTGESTEERIDKMCKIADEHLVSRSGELPSENDATIRRLLEEVRYTVETGGERSRAERAYRRLQAMGFGLVKLEAPPWAELQRSDR